MVLKLPKIVHFFANLCWPQQETYLNILKQFISIHLKDPIKWPHFFIYFSSSNCLRHSFSFLKIAKNHFHGVLLLSILVCKISELWRCKLWDQNFVSFDSGNIHIKESKKPGYIFLSSWEPDLFDLMGYFCLVHNAILHRVEAKFSNFKPIFLRMQFLLVARFFLYFWLSVWIKIFSLNFLMSFYII